MFWIIQLLCSIMLMISVLFTNLSHPISLGLVLIIHAVIIGMLTGCLSANFWFSYVLVLVFLGGVLVLFIYMTSLSSNERFITRLGLFEGSMVVLGAILMTLFMLPSSGLNFNLNGVMSQVSMEASTWFSIYKLMSVGNYTVTLTLIIYLLFVLLVCVTLTKGSSGPLRNFS